VVDEVVVLQQGGVIFSGEKDSLCEGDFSFADGLRKVLNQQGVSA